MEYLWWITFWWDLHVLQHIYKWKKRNKELSITIQETPHRVRLVLRKENYFFAGLRPLNKLLGRLRKKICSVAHRTRSRIQILTIQAFSISIILKTHFINIQNVRRDNMCSLNWLFDLLYSWEPFEQSENVDEKSHRRNGPFHFTGVLSFVVDC